jgi:hypothetical protein
MRTLIELPLPGVPGGGPVDVKVTLKVPSVIVFVPVAPEPATATSENENVPDAVVVVSVLIVIVPPPIPTAACHPAAGLPIRISAFALLSGPSV